MQPIFNIMRTRAFLITILLTFTVQQLLAENRVALVVGNNDYNDAGKLEDLGACKRDAALIKKTLEAVGFTVIYGEDLSKTALDEKLTQFENQIEKGGTAVFYFAGHAIEFEGKNYLLGTNAKLAARSRLGEESMNAETFATAMLLAGAKSSFLLLDCCRDAPTSSEWLSRGGERKAGLAQIDVDGDIIIGYAAKPGASALEPNAPDANSPYAEALAKWIPSGLKHIEVFEKVRQEVNASPDGLQRTWENGSFLEPFFFKPGAAGPKMAVTPSVPPPVVPVVPAPPAADSLGGATKARPFVNSLGQKFVPVLNYTNGTKTLFCIWETRVQDYAAYAAENSGIDMEWKDYEYEGHKQEPEHPVVNVSWEDAKAFCVWLTKKERAAGRIGPKDEYRLPSDMEWSYAVGIGDQEDAKASPESKSGKLEGYPWGATWPPPDRVGNYSSSEAKAAFGFTGIAGYDDGFAFTAPAGSYVANGLGIFDLGGNVYEWCEDSYSSSSVYRVMRGGSWYNYDSTYLLSSYRANVHTPTRRINGFGFRCVVSVGGSGG